MSRTRVAAGMKQANQNLNWFAHGSRVTRLGHPNGMKTGILRLLLLVLAYPSTVLAGVWYAAPKPLPNGKGSCQQPWTRAPAVTNQGLVKPGDTRKTRGGRNK